MRTVNVHEAKTQLSKLLSAVERGETVIIAKAGTPVAKLVPFEPPPAPKRIGFMMDADWVIPDDIDTMFEEDIKRMFYGEEEQ